MKVILLALLLLLTGVGTGAQTPQGPRAVAGWPRIVGNGIFGSAAVADLDRDGRDEIAVGLRDGQVLVLGPDGRTRLGWPRYTAGAVFQTVLFADLDGDGTAEVLAASISGAVHAWRADGRDLPGWPVDLGARAVAAPLAVPLGGAPTVIVATDDGRVHRLMADGAPVRGWPMSGVGRRSPSLDLHALQAADLDGDDVPEILLLGGRDGLLHAWREDGTPLEGFPRELGDHGVGLARTADAGALRLACTTRRSLRLLDAGGRELWSHVLADADDTFEAPPAFVTGPGGQTLVAAGTKLGRVHVLDLDGTTLAGWPRQLGGFIYGLAGNHERFSIFAAPCSLDLDGDGAPELLIPSYDQHLYALDFDGNPVPGWPLTLGDSCRATPTLAQLDGRGPRELVVTQSGETLFAFHLRPPPMVPARPPGRHASAVVIVVTLLLLLLASALRGAPWRRTGVPAAMAGGALVLLVIVSLLHDAQRGRRLHGTAAEVATALARERKELAAQTQRFAAALDSTFAVEDLQGGRLLYHLERLADRAQINHDQAGLVVVGPEGQPRQAIGLLREWALPHAWPAGEDGSAGQLLLGELPVQVARWRLLGALAGHQLVHARSLLDEFPYLVARATGASVHLRLDGRTIAWEGVPPAGAAQAWPWVGVPVPRCDVPAGLAGLSIRLSDENHVDPPLGWLTLLLVVLLPSLVVARWSRVDPDWQPRVSGFALAAMGLLYLAGWLLLTGGNLAHRQVTIAGHGLELLLHLLGWTAVLLAIRYLVAGHRSRRLTFALAGSYLLVSLLPLALALVIVGLLVQQAQQAAAIREIAGLVRRADHLALAHLTAPSFLRGVHELARERFGQPPETGWFNFAAETQHVFTYDLPAAYLTVNVHDRHDPRRRYTGFSWRVPRTEKFPAPRPAWTTGDDPRGLVVDGRRALVRAGRTFRTPELEAFVLAHLPLDATVLGDLASSLRILPFLPRVQLEPAWLDPLGTSDPAPGWRLPLSNRITLPARDWRTGEPRWVVYDVNAFLPSGPAMIPVLLPVLALILLPVGLSAWGALGTWRRMVLPLDSLLTGIRRLADGDLEVRLGREGTSEIAAASRAFDDMAGSLRRTIHVEAERRKAEEMSALKSHFLSMVSHDLKTPLASIQGAAENLLAELAGPLNERQHRYLEMVLTSSGALQQMVADILDLTRIESGHLRLELEDLDLRREVERLLHTLRPLLDEFGLRAEFSGTATRRLIRADRTRLWQVMNNVLSNAVRHSPSGGRIGIHLADAPRGGLRVSVTDEGPGIPESEREQIFAAYYARARGGAGSPGAGLGLAIVRQLVELQGGSVAISEAPGGGARFAITLPGAPERHDQRADSAHRHDHGSSSPFRSH